MHDQKGTDKSALVDTFYPFYILISPRKTLLPPLYKGAIDCSEH
jgi:hypothetical protein